MNTQLVSKTYRIAGVRDDLEVKAIMQQLYDIFTAQGIGQAAVELAGAEQRLVVKHRPDQEPDRQAIADAMARAGNFKLLD